MKKIIKFIFSFFIILLISGCSMLEGLLVPNTSTSSGAYVPNYPIYSSSTSSSISSSSKPSTSTSKPSSSSSSSSVVEYPLEFVVECRSNYSIFTYGLTKYEEGIYYTLDEVYFTPDTNCKVFNKYNYDVLYIDFDVFEEGYRFIRFEIENPNDPQYEFEIRASVELYNPYESYSVIGSFAESLWVKDFYLVKQSENHYVSDTMYFPEGTEFKVRKGSSWDINYGKGNISGGENFRVYEDGEYQVEVDLSSGYVDVKLNLISSTENIVPIKDVIEIGKNGTFDTEKVYTIKGKIIAFDNKNRPFIMDENGDIICVYKTVDALIGNIIVVKGNISLKNDFIRFGYNNFELVSVKEESLSFDIINRSIEYSPAEFIENAGNYSLNGKLIKLSNITLIKSGTTYYLETEESQKIRLYVNNLNLYENFFNDDNVGSKVVAYGCYFDYSSTQVRFVPVFIDNDYSHIHNYVTNLIEPTKDGQGYTNYKCECGDEYNDNYVPALITIEPNDITGPSVTSLKLDKTEVTMGDTIHFEVVIEDESSIYDKSIQFKCGAMFAYVYLSHKEGNIFEGDMYIDESFVNGTYVRNAYWIQDYAGNSAYSCPDASFIVNNPNSTIVVNPNDTVGPSVTSLKLDKTEVTIGDTIHFEVVIEDESSIYDKSIQFKCGAMFAYVYLSHKEGNLYEGDMYIDESFVSGTYVRNAYWIQDYAGNSAYSCPEASFTVTR